YVADVPSRRADDLGNFFVTHLIEIIVNGDSCLFARELAQELTGLKRDLRGGGLGFAASEPLLVEEPPPRLGVTEDIETKVRRCAVKPREGRAPILELLRIVQERQEYFLKHFFGGLLGAEDLPGAPPHQRAVRSVRIGDGGAVHPGRIRRCPAISAR